MRNTAWSLRMWGLRPRSIPRTRRHPDGAHASYSFQASRARRSGSAEAAPQRGRPHGRSGARSSSPTLGPVRPRAVDRGEGARCARRLPSEPDGRGVGGAALETCEVTKRAHVLTNIAAIHALTAWRLY